MREALSYWRGRGAKRADWVLTVANRIYAQDTRQWERAKQTPPTPELWRAAQEAIRGEVERN